MAREKHPGQRNNLDSLVQRYGVGGYDREYHGALVDSKILGNVYLAMTGGQSDLLFENNSIQIGQKNKYVSHKLTSSKIDKRPKLIRLSEQEEKEHLDYLNRMKEETNSSPS